MRRIHLTRTSLALAVSAACALVATPASAQNPSSSSSAGLAAVSADRLIDSPSASASLHVAVGDDLYRTGVVTGTRGLQYVTYARTHRGLPVVGGDVVVTTDAKGAVRATSVAQKSTINVATTATVTAAAATATARARLATVEETGAARLVVLAWGATPRLVWETVVSGSTAEHRPSVLHVFVDARSGAVVDTVDDVREGTGNGFYYGSVALDTSGSGSSFSLVDSTRPGLQCGGQDGAAFTGTDDLWGNGSGTNLETACVDALYGAQRETDMLRDWFNRNGIRGDGTTPPIRVGLNQVNAFWNGSFVNFGHNQSNTRQATPIDVVGHELGHAVFAFTPGGAGGGNENGGINEATGDIFGALTEAYANNPLDPPDYQVGEEVDLVGSGPIRFMYNPSLAGDPNCYSSSIPATEVHAAAGPLNHWFYLAAEGSAPVGKPVSPTCNSSVVAGVGVRKAGEIYYNAMLAKTSTWRYADIRVATLNAAKNLYPTSCAEFKSIKAAWSAINVPAQAGEPFCNVTGNEFSLEATPASGTVDAGQGTTVTLSSAVTAGVPQSLTLTASGLPFGVTAAFEPATINAGDSSTLTLRTSTDTQGGTFPITITGAGDDTRTATFSLTVVGAPPCTASTATPVAIPDRGAAVTSTVTVNGCTRTSSPRTTAEVHIAHTFRGDLVIDLVAPSGRIFRLRNAVGGSDDNIDETFTVDATGLVANGVWTLKVQDVAPGDVGTLNSWTLNA